MVLPNGEECIDQAAIQEAIVRHFKEFLGSEKDRKNTFDRTGFMTKLVPVEEWEMLCSPVKAEEVREALWSIKDDKCPGPDGFNSVFFKKTWGIVGKEICHAIHDFFF